MKKITREYVDLALFQAANNKAREFKVDIIQQDKRIEIRLFWDQYTMNPHGFHIGYITFQVTLPLVAKRHVELNLQHVKIDENAKWLIDLGDATVKAIDYPPSETCDCEDKENCECELYYSPKDDPSWEDFAYQEFDYKLECVLDQPISWKFSGAMGWEISDE